MKHPTKDFQLLASVSDFTRFFGFPAPAHPLFTVIDLAGHQPPPESQQPTLRQFYLVSLKRNLNGRLRYGHGSYDFSEGVLGFYAPGQLCASDYPAEASDVKGWLLARYPLGQKISTYNFFSYQVNETLHLSAPEEAQLDELAASLRCERSSPSMPSARMCWWPSSTCC